MVHPGDRKIGSQALRLGIVVNRDRPLAKARLRVAPVVVGGRIIGIQFQHMVIVRDRPRQIARILPSRPPIQVGIRRIGSTANRFVIVRDRLLQPILAGAGIAPVAPNFRIVGKKFQNLRPVTLGLGKLPAIGGLKSLVKQRSRGLNAGFKGQLIGQTRHWHNCPTGTNQESYQPDRQTAPHSLQAPPLKAFSPF